MSTRQRPEQIQIGRVLPLDRRGALDLLRELSRDRGVLADLRSLWARETATTTLCFASDEQVLAQLAGLVAAGSLVVARLPPPRMGWWPTVGEEGEGAAETSGAAAASEVQEEPSWIEIIVQRGDTGGPVSGIPLLITPASGSEAEHKTDDKGTVRLDKIAKGPCLVRCKLDDEALAGGMTFLGAAGGGTPPEAASGGGKKKSTPCIFRLERHKVRTGETLDSVAKAAGTTAKKLAKFNWGTDDPAQIESMLQLAVGCTKKSADGKSYVFDDSDEPGIVLIPREWQAEGFEAGGSYTVEVTPAAEPNTWVFSM